MNRNEKAKTWGNTKFVPKKRKAPAKPYLREEQATPWSVYKNDMLEKERQEERWQRMDTESEEAKNMFKKRDENYRKMLIMEKPKEPTQWENFDEDGSEEKPIDKTARTTKKEKTKAIISEEQLENFDSKKLAFKQNNELRKIITASHYRKNGSTLPHMLRNMEKKFGKRNKK